METNNRPVRMDDKNISVSKQWKPLIELQVQNDILEGEHNIKQIPIEPPIQRKHRKIIAPL